MRRSTVILLILFALVAGLTWYMQQPDNAIKTALATSTVSAPFSANSLVDPALGPVKRIAMQDATGKELLVDKSSGAWVVDGEPANQDLAETFAGQALTLRILSKLESAPDPAGTGLDKPAYTVSLGLADGSMFVFKIGKATATGSGYYALGADGNVYILNKGAIDNFVSNFNAPPVLQTATPEASVTSTP